MSAVGKLLLAAAVGVAALALLVVLYANARQRARMTHCRNNLRYLGGLAARNWGILDLEKTGRAFWQGVREARYKRGNGRWEPMVPDPFVCPVLGKTASNPEDVNAIDYLGPRRVREQARQTPQAEPIGADRPGNHPSGGHVLRLDTSVEEIPPIIEALRSSDPAWTEALKTLKE